MDMDVDVEDGLDALEPYYGGKLGRAYTEIDFASFKPVHVDGFHTWLRF
jgi:hypothetical protein